MRVFTTIALAILAMFVTALRCPAQDSVKPGPEHAALKQHEGVWDAAVKAYAGPNQPLVESKAVMTCKMGPGDLFVISDFKGDDFSGHGVSGYDPHTKKYTGFWVDSMGPSIMRLEGTFDKSGKTFSETGEVTGQDGKPVNFKMVTEFKDKDMHVFKMSLVGSDGKEELMLNIEYRRRK